MLFVPDKSMSEITLRPYQVEAHEALNNHLRNKDNNPCVVLPTGAGKSIQIASSIIDWKIGYPKFRCAILQHRKELVDQNYRELANLWPGGDIGIYSAALKRKDTDYSVTYAGIDSICNKAGDFPPFNALLIDEAHRIPMSGEGKYRTFINDCKKFNPKLRVIGFTATPYRLGCGNICHKDHILNEICYEINVSTLIEQGYLCRLRSKTGDVQPDLSGVKRNGKGDYVENALAQAVNKADVVAEAVNHAMQAIVAHNRKSIMFFCVDVEHCQRVSNELWKYGIDAPVVHAGTPMPQRDRIADQFKQGTIKAICNVNVYTEGFNAKMVDCIVLFRPTLSIALYQQMVGRGLRLWPNKDYCLVLDYARCIETHGPIDAVEAGIVSVIDCQECGDTFSKAVRKCPNCGWLIPKQIIEREEAEKERERQMHEAKSSNRSILSAEPETLEVSDVSVHLHRKPGSPDSLRVQYRCGMTVVSEWICLDHPGFAGQKAYQWWLTRFGKDEAAIITVQDAVQDMFLPQKIKNLTHALTVIRRGKFMEIVKHHTRMAKI